MNTNKLTPRGQIPREFGIGAPGFLDTFRFADHWMKRLGFDPRLTDTFQWAEYLQNANHLYWRVKSSVETNDIEPIIGSLETFGYRDARKILTGKAEKSPVRPNMKKKGRHRHPEIVVFTIAMRDIFDTGTMAIIGPTRGAGWSRHKVKNNFNVKGGRENPRVWTDFENMVKDWLFKIDPDCDSRLSTTVIKQAKALYRSAGRVIDETEAARLRGLKRNAKKRVISI
jgi:hypothetical protein